MSQSLASLRLFLILAVLTLGLSHVAPASGTAQLTTLYAFSALSNGTSGTNSDGTTPFYAMVIGPDSNLYGTTGSGGTHDDGTVFKITPTGTFTTLYTFTGGNDGASPNLLVVGPDGNFYGSTFVGGSHNSGTIFKITSAGTLTTLYAFSAKSTMPPYTNSDGAGPYGLVVGSDGNFYGTTGSGANGSGTVFKITPAGTLTTLHTFSAAPTPPYINSDGANPNGLTVGADSNFYGTTEQGGTSGYGTVFKITSTGTLTTLANFDYNNNGAIPDITLAVGSDNDLYGTTNSGGANADGTVFKITPSGTLTTIYNFSTEPTAPPYANNDGYNPNSLISGQDGNLYGTTGSGGVNGSGTVFKITPFGTLTTLYAFSTASGNYPYSVNSDGAYPFAALVLGPNGNFYGTTRSGGANGTGTIFSLSANPVSTWSAVAVGAGPSGTGRILWDRSDGAAGLWALNGNDTQSAVGPTYGPYAGWTAKAVVTAPNGTSRVLWTNVNGQASIWTFNASGVETSEGPTYGPYSGWTAQSVGVAGDGTSRVLWTNTNGEAGVWSFGTNDAETVIGPTYGPISGWAAKSLSTASDGTSRVLWDRSDGAAGVWSFGANDAVSVYGTVYGPYTGWTAGAIGAAGDGTSRVLWTNTDGRAGLWSFNTHDVETIIGTTYGPYSGFGAVALGVSTDGTSRVLWGNSDRSAGVWSFAPNDVDSVIGPTYGPY